MPDRGWSDTAVSSRRRGDHVDDADAVDHLHVVEPTGGLLGAVVQDAGSISVDRARRAVAPMGCGVVDLDDRCTAVGSPAPLVTHPDELGEGGWESSCP